MAIPTLTEEQVRTWSREQKDRWWLANVFRGNMAQLTLRSAVTGFILGGLLSATNLYIGAKTGWTLGVGLTSVILAFAMFKVLSTLGAKDMTILENNAMQSIATSAGYMTGPLISGMAAYMMVTNKLMPWWQMLLFNVVLSILGVLVAFPMKRRFINDEQMPFPEGAACGVVLDTLYTSEAKVGLFKAKALVVAGLLAAFLKLISAEAIQTAIQAKLLGLHTTRWISEEIDHWWYKLAGLFTSGHPAHIKMANVDIRQIGIAPGLEVAMVGAGGLMGIRSATNMLVGMIITWVVLVPIYIANGVITPKTGSVAAGDAVFNQRDILLKWPLWPGVCIVVLASLVAFFAKPQVIIGAFKGFFGRKGSAETDVLKDIEVPAWVSFAGIPVVGAVGVWMAHAWFGVPWLFGTLAIVLICALTLIAVNATGLTSITPTGSLSKITQLTFGLLDRGMAAPGIPPNPAVNLMTATMTTEVASNAANLLMDIKPGYMLGAKPRQQIMGHCIGIFAGAIASTPLFFLLFLNRYEEGKNVGEVLTSGDFSFTAAVQWKGLSDVITGVLGGKGMHFHDSIWWAMGIASAVAIVFEVARIVSKNKLHISPVALGLGVVLPPESTMAMFFGSALFWSMEHLYRNKKGTFAHHLWVDTKEPICAGLIAGWSLTGILDILIGIGNEKLWP